MSELLLEKGLMDVLSWKIMLLSFKSKEQDSKQSINPTYIKHIHARGRQWKINSGYLWVCRV